MSVLCNIVAHFRTLDDLSTHMTIDCEHIDVSEQPNGDWTLSFMHKGNSVGYVTFNPETVRRLFPVLEACVKD